MTSETLLAGYMLTCLLLTAILYAVSWLDFSSFVRRDDSRSESGSFFLYPNHAFLILSFGVVGLLLLILFGWRIPLEIERLYGAGGEFAWFMPTAEMSTLGRAAQVIGAVCFFLIGLRWMKPVIFIGLLVSVFVLGLLAFTYVFP